MASVQSDFPYREVEQRGRTFRRKRAPQSTTIHSAAPDDGLLKPFLNFSEPYLLTSSSHSHAFLFSLLLLLVDFDLGRVFLSLLEQRISYTKKDVRVLNQVSNKISHLGSSSTDWPSLCTTHFHSSYIASVTKRRAYYQSCLCSDGVVLIRSLDVTASFFTLKISLYTI